MVLGRLRGATSEQLGEAARQLGARQHRHQAAIAVGLTAPVERSGGLLGEAEDRRDQRMAELDRAAELLRSAAAWIQRGSLPPRTSQPGPAERVP